MLSHSPNGKLGPGRIAFKSMVTFFVACSVADIVVTNFGLGIGCVELNGFVLSAGLGLWGVFRVGLLGYLVAVFFFSYRYCHKHFMNKGLTMVKISLLAVDVYIGIVVASGLLALITQIA